MKASNTSDELDAMVRASLASTPFEVVAVEFRRSGKEWFLRIYIDHEDGVTHDHCETVTRLVSAALDEADPIEHAYLLEVSSPGVDRPLVRPQDFQRFQGERVQVKSYSPIAGRKVFTGVLVAGESEAIRVRIEDDGKEYDIPLESIAKATLKPVLNFGRGVG